MERSNPYNGLLCIGVSRLIAATIEQNHDDKALFTFIYSTKSYHPNQYG